MREVEHGGRQNRRSHGGPDHGRFLVQCKDLNLDSGRSWEPVPEFAQRRDMI